MSDDRRGRRHNSGKVGRSGDASTSETAGRYVDSASADHVERSSSLRYLAWSILRSSWPARIGLFLVALFVATVVAGPLLVGDAFQQDLGSRLAPPFFVEGGTTEHLLGTDQLGRDLMARVVYGGRISLTVALLAVLIAGVVGTAVGMWSGYSGGAIDRIVTKAIDIQVSVPFILLVILFVAALGPNTRNLILILGISGWVLYARIVRSESLTIRELGFVESARSIGLTDAAIIRRYIMPNILPSAIVVASFTTAQMIIMEAALSFLGLGIQSPTPSWGSMLSDSRDYLSTNPWMATVPGVAIMLTVLGINLFGDYLRDVLDPRLGEK